MAELSSMHAPPILARWNFKILVKVFVIALALQQIVLPCLCEIGAAKIKFAFIIDLLIVMRCGIAYLTGEQGDGWKFYAWLLATSPLWIEIAAYLRFGQT